MLGESGMRSFLNLNIYIKYFFNENKNFHNAKFMKIIDIKQIFHPTKKVHVLC